MVGVLVEVCCFVNEYVCIDSPQNSSRILASSHGAGSPVIEEAIRRISAGLGTGADSPDLYAQTITKSFCLSIDQAHAVHPNYAAKHEVAYCPTQMTNGAHVPAKTVEADRMR